MYPTKTIHFKQNISSKRQYNLRLSLPDTLFQLDVDGETKITVHIASYSNLNFNLDS